MGREGEGKGVMGRQGQGHDRKVRARVQWKARVGREGEGEGAMGRRG